MIKNYIAVQSVLIISRSTHKFQLLNCTLSQNVSNNTAFRKIHFNEQSNCQPKKESEKEAALKTIVVKVQVVQPRRHLGFLSRNSRAALLYKV